MPWWLILALLMVTSAILFTVGAVVARRDLHGPQRTANRLFAAWWRLEAAAILLRAAVAMTQRLGGPDLALQIAYTHVLAVVSMTAFWAISSYLAFVFTGSSRSWWVMAAVYIPATVGLFYAIAAAQPIAVEIGTWETQLVFQDQVEHRPVVQSFVFFLLLPPLLGALGYLGLLSGAETSMQRFRIVVVGGSLFLWFGSRLVAFFLGWSDLALWHLYARLIGISAAGAILLAYQPPAWLRRRLAGAP